MGLPTSAWELLRLLPPERAVFDLVPTEPGSCSLWLYVLVFNFRLNLGTLKRIEQPQNPSIN